MLIGTTKGAMLATVHCEYYIQDIKAERITLVVSLAEEAAIDEKTARMIAQEFMLRIDALDPYLAKQRVSVKYLELSFPIAARPYYENLD
jgi:hypothetical protein